jgi:hypothetical protein
MIRKVLRFLQIKKDYGKESIWKDGWESNKWKIGDLKVAYREK